MGKLNIAHHKSYHPYRRDNIERVRRDEEEARLKEAVEEGRMRLADSEARMDLLRARAGLGGSGSGSGSKGGGKARKTGDDEDDEDDEDVGGGAGPSGSGTATAGAGSVPTLTSTTGHINFFEDLERSVIPVHGAARSTKRQAPPAESEKGVALAPSAKDLRPWYTGGSAEKEKEGETDEGKRRRDLQRKSAHDPLTAINTQLAARSTTAPSASAAPTHASRSRQRAYPPPSSASSSRHGPGPGADSSSSSASRPHAPPAVAARLERESSERQRALELIARKKREMVGGETPSTVRGGGYGDVYNRREVEEVRRERMRGREWDRERDRDRDFGRTRGGGRARERERDSDGGRRDWGR
ncbi:hypothetical protein C8Q78DRAFT_456686 [Trametes maxima]|nr:hypothetical protein C8Q78DRAFT_456686 [Trametes maxima]